MWFVNLLFALALAPVRVPADTWDDAIVRADMFAAGHRKPAEMNEAVSLARRRLLDATGRVRAAGSATDPQTALAELRDRDVDVLFLDIQMPGLTGFDIPASTVC